jgi:hypothetical protein
MTRTVVVFVAALAVFAMATVGFADGDGASASELRDEEHLEFGFSTNQTTSDFDTVDPSSVTTTLQSDSPDDADTAGHGVSGPTTSNESVADDRVATEDSDGEHPLTPFDTGDDDGGDDDNAEGTDRASADTGTDRNVTDNAGDGNTTTPTRADENSTVGDGSPIETTGMNSDGGPDANGIGTPDENGSDDPAGNSSEEVDSRSAQMESPSDGEVAEEIGVDAVSDTESETSSVDDGAPDASDPTASDAATTSDGSTQSETTADVPVETDDDTTDSVGTDGKGIETADGDRVG